MSANTQRFKDIRMPEHCSPDAVPLFLRHLAAYSFALNYVKDKIVLDVGCGDGYGTALLAREATRIVGIDLDPERIKAAQRQYLSDNITFLQMDIFRLNLEKECFDVVVGMQVVEHISNPPLFFDKIKYILKPGGTLILSTPNKKLRLGPREKPFNPDHVREYYRYEFETLLAQHFFRVQLFGIVGSQKAAEWERLRLHRNIISKIIKFDFLNLRRLIPKGLRKFARRYGWRERDEKRKLLAPTIASEDFKVGDGDIDNALDFIAVGQVKKF